MAVSSDNMLTQETAIGTLPVDWEIVKLGDVTFESTDRNRGLEYDRSKVLTVSNEVGLVWSDRVLGDDFSRYKVVRKGYFAYNPMRLNVRSIGLWRQDDAGIVSPDYIVLSCKTKRIEPDFLDLFRDTSAWDAQIRQSGQGSVRIRYYYRHISEFKIPLPPLEEQRAIARVLRTVQQAKEATEKILAAARHLKQSMLRHLFTYGPVPFGQADKVILKETEIGPVPAHWSLRTLGQLARIGNGSTPKRTNTAYWNGGSFPWLTSGKVHERIIDQADEFISDTAVEECHLPLVKKGSLVVAITGQGKTLGSVALLGIEARVSQHLAYLQFHDAAVKPEFLLNYLHTRYADLRRSSQGAGSTKGALTCGFLKTYLVPLPPIAEQQQVVHVMATVEQKLAAEEARRQALDALFQTLLHNLMTGKLRVHDLDTRAVAGGVP